MQLEIANIVQTDLHNNDNVILSKRVLYLSTPM